MKKNKFHYCCIQCVYDHRNNMDDSYKPSPKHILIKCNTCNKEFKKWKSNIENYNHNFCSKKCYGNAISLNVIPMPIKMTDEIKLKIGELAKERYKTILHPFLGKHHKEETKNKIREKARIRYSDPTKNPMYRKHHTEKTRQLMSEKQSSMVLQGRNVYGNGHINGFYISDKNKKTMFYRSSWELACMVWLERNKNIHKFLSEPFRVEYSIFDHERYYKRYYIPDFLVEFSDGHKELWEIKPKAFLTSQATLLKKEAAKKYCQENNINVYKILTKEDLVFQGIL